VLFCLCGTPVSAEVPPLPHAFYGAVEINGSPAPVGTQVEAAGEGVLTSTAGNPLVTIEPGKYGDAGPLEPKLVVQGDITDGATLTFYVNGVAATPTADWHSGEVTTLDIMVSISDVTPMVTTNQATGIGTTTATLEGVLTSLGGASSVEVSFQWGTTTGYGNETASQSMSSTGSYSASLSGLSLGTIYHFRAKVVGQATSYGVDRTFTTGGTVATTGGGGGGADTTAPRISSILVSEITETSATISWTTHEKSDSLVEYWFGVHKFSPVWRKLPRR